MNKYQEQALANQKISNVDNGLEEVDLGLGSVVEVTAIHQEEDEFEEPERESRSEEILALEKRGIIHNREQKKLPMPKPAFKHLGKRSQFMLLLGPSGVGKTTFCIAWAHALSLGMNLLDLEEFPAGEPGLVVVFAVESPELLSGRGAAWDLQHDRVGNVVYVKDSEEYPQLYDQNVESKFGILLNQIQQAHGEPVIGVGFDSLISMINRPGIELPSSADFGKGIELVDRLSRVQDVFTLATHHLTADETKALGPILIEAKAASLFVMAYAEGVERLLTLDKSRTMQKDSYVTCNIEEQDYEGVAVITNTEFHSPSELKPVEIVKETAKLGTVKHKILKASEGNSKLWSYQDYMDKFTCGLRRVQDATKELVEEGLLTKSTVGKKNFFKGA